MAFSVNLSSFNSALRNGRSHLVNVFVRLKSIVIIHDVAIIEINIKNANVLTMIIYDENTTVICGITAIYPLFVSS